ncbi:predicted protein [Postia placenta Mad-698-R]|uniref:TRIP4/RQT4 C2HC5-type zinc finger domain-containing protein n=1 Tax=Postia placenta MAD-698-R-SB12 TaxID=670580 RepID=A0A1X6N5C1_9APHY|nr:hypothetical protein POSPLADRAFT_1044999 [Postia placenta MAD-698-R-SB12]EED80681.1 predicted protein [Postia placenta Mad-698-R]OSX63807.1 hypothetical protein POSPLADRAFT_1044999 [Postia placenta MAD-698-R-SB12]
MAKKAGARNPHYPERWTFLMHARDVRSEEDGFWSAPRLLKSNYRLLYASRVHMLVIFFGILSKSIVFSSSKPPSATQVNATAICEVRCFKWRISDTTEDVIEFVETHGKPEPPHLCAMHHTAWTLTSDRIPPPKLKRQPAPSKGEHKPQEPPKSEEVRRLEELCDALQSSSGREKDPKGGCFCQARMHPLSQHAPICRSCGLILCTLNLPHFACPHCAAPLLIPAARDALLATITASIVDTLAREEAARERAAEEARTAAGAFPVLAPTFNAPGADRLAAHPANQSHKVLSLNSKTKRVTVASYRAPSPAARPQGKGKGKERTDEEDERRVPPPPQVVVHSAMDVGVDNPWTNLRGGRATYVPSPIKGRGEGKGRRDKGKQNKEQPAS